MRGHEPERRTGEVSDHKCHNRVLSWVLHIHKRIARDNHDSNRDKHNLVVKSIIIH